MRSWEGKGKRESGGEVQVMLGQGFSEVYARVCRERGKWPRRGHWCLASLCRHRRNCPLPPGRPRVRSVLGAPRSLNQACLTRTRSPQSRRPQRLRLAWEAAALVFLCASDFPAHPVQVRTHICRRLKGCSGAPIAPRRKRGERGHDLYARTLGHPGQARIAGRASGARTEVFRYGVLKEAWM
jgi:hypothetical protein